MDDVSGRLRFDHPPIATSESRRDDGRAARSWMRRSAHSVYTPPAGRDPIGILKTQNENRLPWLGVCRDRKSTRLNSSHVC